MTKAYFSCSAYHMSGRNIIQNRSLSFKFDTGATSTFITVGALRTDIEADEKELQQLFEKCKKNGILSNTYMSASGQEMFAIRCFADNVILGNITFSTFYYWLSPMIQNKKLLLGDDFVRFCSFTHAPESDIVIDDFKMDDYIRYNMRIEKTMCISQNEILEMISNV